MKSRFPQKAFEIQYMYSNIYSRVYDQMGKVSNPDPVEAFRYFSGCPDTTKPQFHGKFNVVEKKWKMFSFTLFTVSNRCCGISAGVQFSFFPKCSYKLSSPSRPGVFNIYYLVVVFYLFD